MLVYHLKHEVEAEPIEYFLEGYDETHYYIDTMCRFLQEFFQLTEAEADSFVKALENAYVAALPANQDGFVATGHIVQICLPRAALDRFAYPSIAWGFPAKLFKDSAGRTHVFPVFKDMRYSKKILRDTAGMMPVSQAEFLRSPEMSGLQTRILAHPNLFLVHGAVCNVFHANPGFDARAFRARMLEILHPLVTLRPHPPSLHFTLFRT